MPAGLSKEKAPALPGPSHIAVVRSSKLFSPVFVPTPAGRPGGFFATAIATGLRSISANETGS